jgi:hypothetical protein
LRFVGERPESRPLVRRAENPDEVAEDRPRRNPSKRMSKSARQPGSPAATMVEGRRFLEDVTGKALSDSTIGRLLRRMGFSPKKRSVGALERDE